MPLNECRVPSTRTRGARATISRTCWSVAGRCSLPARYAYVPAQLASRTCGRPSAQHEARAERVARVEDEAVLAGPERRALDLREQPVRRRADRTGVERGAGDRVVAPRLPRRDRARVGEQRGARGRR